jgi:hypothetical protein
MESKKERQSKTEKAREKRLQSNKQIWLFLLLTTKRGERETNREKDLSKKKKKDRERPEIYPENARITISALQVHNAKVHCRDLYV